MNRRANSSNQRSGAMQCLKQAIYYALIEWVAKDAFKDSKTGQNERSLGEALAMQWTQADKI